MCGGGGNPLGFVEDAGNAVSKGINDVGNAVQGGLNEVSKVAADLDPTTADGRMRLAAITAAVYAGMPTTVGSTIATTAGAYVISDKVIDQVNAIKDAKIKQDEFTRKTLEDNQKALDAAKLVQENALKEQKTASDKALADQERYAKEAADKADQAYNAANPKSAGNGMGVDQNAAKGGVGGTMLTGPKGVDPTTLLLGKKTLLGA